MTDDELLRVLYQRIYRNLGRRCSQFDYSCWVCQNWMAYDIIKDMLEFGVERPRKWWQFWKGHDARS